jgi:DNA polymerase-3 subunit alpha
MKHVEQAGLVKFDFLGLTTLTILRRAENFLKGLGTPVDLDKLPLDDTRTFEMLQKGDAGGVFQMEGQGMRDTLRQMKPDRFEDLIAAVALYRPGPMANIPDYCRRKHGEKWAAPHPQLAEILGETYGIMVYQEQVMQIAQTMAGYSLGSADLLRRAMGKKIAAEMEAQRNIFTEGAIKRGISPAKATEVFDLMARFADYGFNKSHAAAYALVAYQTAWLKANHPEVFLASCMSLALNNTDRLAALKQEAERGSIKILPVRCRFRRGANRGWRAGDPLRTGSGQEGRLCRHGVRRRRPRCHAVRRSGGFRDARRSPPVEPHAVGKPCAGRCL